MYCLPLQNFVGEKHLLPNKAALPGPERSPEDVGGSEMKYYQWVLVIIAFMIFMFIIPGERFFSSLEILNYSMSA